MSTTCPYCLAPMDATPFDAGVCGACGRTTSDVPQASLPTAPVDEARVWFAMAGRERVGPLSATELASLRQAGALEEQAFVWRPGMETWQPLTDVAELSMRERAPTPPPPPVASGPGAPLSAPTTGGAAARLDVFRSVPDSSLIRQASTGDTTNAVIAASGAKRSRLPTMILAAVAVFGVAGGSAWLSLRRVPVEVAAPRPVVAPPALVDVAQVAPLDDAAAGILAGGSAVGKRAGREGTKAAGTLAGLVPVDAEASGAKPVAELALLEAARAERPATVKQPVSADDGLDALRSGPDVRAVARRIGQARPAFESCAMATRRREPDLVVGKVVVTATVEPSGHVSKVVFDKPGLDGSDVGRCLSRAVSGLSMPPFRGEAASVDIPLMIGSGGAV